MWDYAIPMPMPEPCTFTIKKLPGSVREITVETSPSEAEKFFRKALEALAREIELKGFRKGNVPPDIASPHIRQDVLFDEAARVAVAETYPKAVTRYALEPIGKPEIEVLKIAKGDALHYRIRVAILPEVKLPDWKKINVKRNVVTVEAEELDKAIGYLQRSRAQHIAVMRPAERGDFAEVDFTIRVGGVILEHGSSQKHPVVIGEEKLMPGFEQQLVGMRVGEEKTFSLVFPTDWHQKSYAEKTAQCQVKLVSLLERKLPERNDAFAASLGAFKTFAELETSVREGLLREKEEAEGARVQMAAVTAIAAKTDIEIPDVLTSREVEKMFEDLIARLEAGGLTLDVYLSHLKKTREALAREWRGEAEQRVKIALTLRALAQQEYVTATDAEREAKMHELAKNYGSPKEAKRHFSEDTLREYVEQAVTNEKVLELIEKTCVINS